MAAFPVSGAGIAPLGELVLRAATAARSRRRECVERASGPTSGPASLGAVGMLWTVKPRCSLYVDVGYLLSAAAVRVTGTSLRNGIQVDYEPLIDALVQQAEALSELPVLRVHWYDSARDGVP